MKYEKAMVNIINLGNEDILTCSKDTPQNSGNNHMNYWIPWWMSWIIPKPGKPRGGRTYGGNPFGHW